MAELSPARDRVPTRPLHAATPEHWEMRLDFKTPCVHDPLQRGSCGGKIKEEEEAPSSSSSASPGVGMSDSFSGFLDFEMYETPPGARLFREQYDGDDEMGDCRDMSLQDASSSREPEPSAQPQNAISEDLRDDDATVTTGTTAIPMYSHSPEENAAGILTHHEGSPGDDLMGQLSQEHCRESGVEEEDKKAVEGLHVEAMDKAILDGSWADLAEDISVTGGEDASSGVLLHDSRQGIEGTVEQDDLQVSGEHEAISEQSNEQMKDVNERSDIHTDVEHDKSPSRPLPLQDVVEDCILERLDHQTQQLNNQPACLKEKSEDTDVDTYAGSHFGDINTSLMSLGAPQDANELNQLADFLNMDDPFMSHAAHGPTKDPVREEQDTHPIIGESIVSPGILSQRTRRKRKVHAAKNERRRSVRIAQRGSLLSIPSPCKVNDGADRAHGSSSLEDHTVLASRSQISKDSQEIPNVDGVPKESSSHQPVTDVETFQHLNIDLPMPTDRKKKTKSTRRKSSRLLQSAVQLVQEESSSVPSSTLAVESAGVRVNGGCDSGFLADFADFGLGDDWMPGEMFAESQFAKTPKQKSGRRKSARLSGVPISLLELKDNSKVRIRHATRPLNEEMEMENFPPVNMPDDWAIAATTRLSDIHASDVGVMEDLPDLPFQKTEPSTSSRSQRKTGTQSNRRRSLRLAKKPVIEPEIWSTASRECKDQGKTVSGYSVEDNPVQDHAELHTLLDMQTLQGRENSDGATELVVSPTAATAVGSLRDECMDYEHQANNECVDSGEGVEGAETVRQRRPSRDTPYMGRKRVSRVVEEDDDAKPNEAQADQSAAVHEVLYSKMSQESEDKENQSTRQTDMNVLMTSSKKSTGTQKKKASPEVKVTKKVKDMYLNKGGDPTKHKTINLETVFESPPRKETGTPVRVLGARKVKRAMAFAETPWLGRTGRTKGRKVRKGKQVKRILSSTVERSWKLDIRLSAMQGLSP